METNLTEPARSDRIMWFSMWFLWAITTFGLVFFPLFYYSIERRNAHFKRQQKLETIIAAFKNEEWQSNVVPNRNSKLWTVAAILVLPVFAIMYFLTVDLVAHERRQKEFFSKICPELKYEPQRISVRKYILITVASLGVGIVYWLYKIVNAYNNHFKEQTHVEHEMFILMEAERDGESM